MNDKDLDAFKYTHYITVALEGLMVGVMIGATIMLFAAPIYWLITGVK